MAVPTLVLPVSGPYVATWYGFALGTQNDDGFVLMGSYQGQEVNASDAYGMTLVEAIWRGLNWRMRMRGLEWNRPGILAAMQAFGSVGLSATTFTPILTRIGDRYSRYAQALVMAAILGIISPTFPTTLTALNAIIAPQSNVEGIMTSKLREAPMEMVFLPYTAIANGTLYNVSFSTT